MTKAKRSVIGAYGREPFISAVTDHAHVGDARKRYWRSSGELPPPARALISSGAPAARRKRSGRSHVSWAPATLAVAATASAAMTSGRVERC